MATTNAVFTYTPSQIPIFDGEHSDYWSSQMERIFISQELQGIVEEGYEESPGLESGSSWAEEKQKEYKENAKKKATALRIIQLGVSKSIYPRICGLKKAKESWDVQRNEFQRKEFKSISIKLQNLWREFDDLLTKDNELV